MKWIVAVLIAAAVAGSYLPTLNNGWVWDDKHNFVENPDYRGVSPSQLSWMFTTFHDANYHPLCWISLGVDYLLWGMNPGGYHLSNLFLHIVNALIVFFLIQKIWIRLKPSVTSEGILAGAGVGALFFSIHPLRVETVAFISTRGDLLSCLFYSMTISAYISMVDCIHLQQKRKWLFMALVAFFLSLLSRAWGITLPVVLLILDIYPLKRLSREGNLFKEVQRLLVEKVPFFFFAFLAAGLALWAKKGPMVPVAEHGVVDRMAQAAYGLGFYLWKTVYPTGLSPLYLLKENFSFFNPEYLSYAVFAAGMTLLLLLKRRQWPWALSAWCVYGLIVSPLLGLVQSGPQLAADRYTYISCIPFAVLAGAGAIKGWGAFRKKCNGNTILAIAGFCVAALLCVFSYGAYRQSQVWHNDDTLWSQAIRVDPKNYIAHGNRGVFRLEKEKDIEGALADYNRAISLKPENPGFYFNRGLLYEFSGDIDSAVADYTQAIKLDPNHAKAFTNRGGLLRRRGDLMGALEDFNQAVRLAPASPEAYASRGMLWFSLKDLKKAAEDFKKAVAVAQSDWGYRENALAMIRRIEKGRETNPKENGVY